ncbi:MULTISPECIES: hypothetical protein [Rhizobium]|uniref:Uncharacterized protein n=1 Tax=Rhizobium tropici TaxID=398 RepID=A0A329Y951_RHITR|nr:MULTISPECIES: hypothetical protein [Rhizobium]MBB3285613.1 hypothetical protein [Rhizobium sp. BK252]MBB3400353.1 hypothetical protein [Rhizobium sp. BK289]MBB3412932.1 hypothetical protein [Rhizobium sp. BK284]MBB3480819.1 hypothetical protein [Rhizobium sp. BK347]RAX38472.1 hypothetical protein DQ393_28170 [Rhizobium tropici]
MQANQAPSPSQTDVLICLDNQQVASRIGTVLSQQGLTVLIIPTTGLQEWFEPNGCQLVVTHTAMIGQVRNRFNLPVVNIEAFIFDRPEHTTEGAARQFDGDAFVKRVFLVMNGGQKRAAE